MTATTTEKAKATATFTNEWAHGGTSVAEVRYRALQGDVEVPGCTKFEPYDPNSATLSCSWGAELPNGDTVIKAVIVDAARVPVGEEKSFFLNVDKTLVPVVDTVTAQ